tara:strand:- start:1059 stop:2117 length:1059 start_codon:yes stop_codon:yes gene_type:complete
MKYRVTKLSNNLKLDIDVVEIENSNNYKIKFYTFGGYFHEVLIPTLQDPAHREDVLLSYNNFEDLIENDGYFNSIIGRVCNRIKNSSFFLNGKKYNLFPNDNLHHIHGGNNGFNKKIWTIENIEKNENSIKCTLQYFSKDLEENYPGNLECRAIYELNNNNEISISYNSKSDQDTIVNMTNHNYWNFHGHKNYYQNITDHVVKIDSKHICQNDSSSIPTGKILNVKGSKFDLNKFFLIDNAFLNNGGIDNNYSLLDIKHNNSVAQIFSKKTGMGAEYSTNQPGIQFYTGNMMKKKYNGKYGKKYGVQYGMCLETQNFPDAINNPNFPSPILKKGKIYKSFTKIKLRNDYIRN